MVLITSGLTTSQWLKFFEIVYKGHVTMGINKNFTAAPDPLQFPFQILILAQAAQTLFVIYIRNSIALRFEPFKRMYENGLKIALNSTCSEGFK